MRPPNPVPYAEEDRHYTWRIVSCPPVNGVSRDQVVEPDSGQGGDELPATRPIALLWTPESSEATMVRRGFTTACACALLLSFTVAATSWIEPVQAQSAQAADDQGGPPEYHALVERAVRARDGGDYAKARDLFQQAHRIYPSARSLRALGMVAFELGEYVESCQLLEEALHSEIRVLDATSRRKTHDLLVRARQFVGEIELELAPKDVAGVMLQVDGVSTPYAGAPLMLGAGEHQVTVTAPGYELEEHRLTVQGGKVQRLTLAMQPTPVRVSPAAQNSAPPVFPQDATRQDRPLYKNPWLWTGVGALVLGGVLTGVLLALRDDPKPSEPIPGELGGVVHVLRSRP